MKLSPNGRKLLQMFEGFRENAYVDVAGVNTIGYGFTSGAKPGDTMTREQAERRLTTELVRYETAVDLMASCNQNQFDAFVCCAWNIGVEGLRKSSMIKAHNRGDHQAAARAFGLWDKAGGKVYPGLTRRRAAEAALYLTPMPDDVSDPVEGPSLDMPQAVDPETPMTKSTINRASVVAGGTAAVATVTQTVQAVNELKDSVTGLGAWLVPALLIVTICAVGYIVIQRFRQRSQGWA